MNWQAEHERLMAEMAKLAGGTVYDIYYTLDHIHDPEIKRKLIELNEQNTHAVDMYYKTTRQHSYERDDKIEWSGCCC